MLGKTLFSRMKKYIVIPQEYNKNYIRVSPETPSNLLLVKLTAKEQKIYDKLTKEYIKKSKEPKRKYSDPRLKPFPRDRWGKPRNYETPEELWNKSMEYFEYCLSKKIDRGIQGKIHKPFTISGLNLWLEVGKNYLREKLKDKEYEGTVSTILNIIENDTEDKGLIWVYWSSMVAFNLWHNFWWSSKHEVKKTDEFTWAMSDESQKLIDELAIE